MKTTFTDLEDLLLTYFFANYDAASEDDFIQEIEDFYTDDDDDLKGEDGYPTFSEEDLDNLLIKLESFSEVRLNEIYNSYKEATTK